MKDYPDYPVHRIMTIPDLFRYSVAHYGSHVAFRRTYTEVTYQQLESDVLRVAASMLQYQGCYVLLQAEDPVLFSIGFFATILTGNVAVLVNMRHCPHGVQLPPIALTLTDQQIPSLLSVPAVSYSALPLPDIEKACTIVYSSGTTSSAKGVMLSQKNLCCNVVSGLEKYRFTSRDRLVQLVPYHHAFGLVCDLLAPLLSGTTICVPDSKVQALSQMAFFKPTMLNAPPAIAQALLSMAKQAGNLDMFSGGQLRKILCGGAGLRPEITNELLKWGVKALGCYGISECSPCVSVNRDNYYKPGSAGLPLNCNKIRIAEDGEILIRGSNVMLGYYSDSEKTSRVIIDGEYHTGDLGFIDADNFLYVTGRKSNLIVFEDGTKCIPELLEEQIMKHPLVKEAVVFAREIDKRLSLCARIYALQGQDEIRKYILSIPSYQPFARIEFLHDPLPKTATGKIRRYP